MKAYRWQEGKGTERDEQRKTKEVKQLNSKET